MLYIFGDIYFRNFFLKHSVLTSYFRVVSLKHVGDKNKHLMENSKKSYKSNFEKKMKSTSKRKLLIFLKSTDKTFNK